MIYRLKFRVYGTDGSGKFVYNVREGATLYLNETFRPAAGGPELAHYGVFIRSGRTTAALLKSGAQWNNQPPTGGPIELGPGHILTANGVGVEILECPHVAAPEATKFLDLDFLMRQVAPPAPARFEDHGVDVIAARAPAPPPVTTPAPAPVPRGPAPAPLPHVPELKVDTIQPDSSFEEPDKLVVPISLGSFAHDEDDEPIAIPSPEAVRLTPAPAPAPAQKGFPGKSDDSTRARETTLKRAAYVAGGFVVAIAAIYFNSDRFQFDLFEDSTPTSFVVITPPRPKRVAAAMPQATRAPASGAAPGAAPAESITPLEAISVPAVPPPPKKLSPENVKELTKAIDEGNMPVIRQYVESERVSPDFALDDLGRSPFLRAAAAGRVTVMQYLLTKKVSVTTTDYNGSSALMWAVINGREKTVKFLLSLGLDPTIKRDDKKDCFELAREYRQKGVAKILHDGFRAANVPVTDDRKPASK